MSRLINTRDLHNVVTKRKAEYGKLATLVDNIVEEMVKETPTSVRISGGVTNGDIIKDMFPYSIKSNYIESDLNMKDYVTIYLGDYEMRVSYDWWNAKYRKVEE